MRRFADEDSYEFEERAAILEYDAKMNRADAEFHARRMIQEKEFLLEAPKASGIF